MANNEKPQALRLWQQRYSQAKSLYEDERAAMDRRSALYKGRRELRPLVEGDSHSGPQSAAHVRNIVFENIESQVSSSIPQPKVTARRREDEGKARLIENLLRNELDRLPFERINDLMERLVPVQGGGIFLVEWDNSRRTHSTVGEVVVSALHPKQFIPQPGVYTGIEDMDYFFLLLPRTRGYTKRAYGKDLEEDREEEPEVRGEGDGEDTAPDMLTQVRCYYRNGKGGIGLFSWVNDTVLEDFDDYQARRLSRCRGCGTARTPGQDRCPRCGGTWTETAMEQEEFWLPSVTAMGSMIPGARMAADESGMAVLEPLRVPYYKPDMYPVVLQRSVSTYGQFLGSSDVDMIEDQQNTVNRLETKILDRLLKAGTRVTLPDKTDFRIDPKDGEKWYVGNPADKALIDVYEFSGNLQYEMAHLGNVYEEARQTIGITDSFQGRRDTTATSGAAKQFSAAQAAGRLESKRAMKDAAYADLFQIMFRMWLAYADEPRQVTYRDARGQTQYEKFDRYDFLQRDEAGEWYWNDEFLFSVDAATGLENNRQAMWEETLKNLQAGTFGDPARTDTLILYWTKMEMLHYPGAGETKAYLERQREQEQMAMQAQQAAQMQQGQQMAGVPFRETSQPVGAAAFGGPLERR